MQTVAESSMWSIIFFHLDILHLEVAEEEGGEGETAGVVAAAAELEDWNEIWFKSHFHSK